MNDGVVCHRHDRNKVRTAIKQLHNNKATVADELQAELTRWHWQNWADECKAVDSSLSVICRIC